jgi:hypothetical protein
MTTHRKFARYVVAGREPAPFPPDHPVWTPPPGTPGPGQVFPGSQQRCGLSRVLRLNLTPEQWEQVAVANEAMAGYVVWTEPVPEWNVRQCIACGADVFRRQSEACPHE